MAKTIEGMSCKGCGLCIIDRLSLHGHGSAVVTSQGKGTGSALCAAICPDVATELFQWLHDNHGCRALSVIDIQWLTLSQSLSIPAPLFCHDSVLAVSFIAGEKLPDSLPERGQRLNPAINEGG